MFCLLANLPPPTTHIRVSGEMVPFFQVIAGLALALAAASAGFWIIRSRGLRTTFGRILILLAGGLVAVGVVAGWLAANPWYGQVRGELAPTLVLNAWWLFALGYIAVVVFGWKWVKRPQRPGEQIGPASPPALRKSTTEAECAALATDPGIQRETKAINEEIMATDNDGLERL